jgi:hypothetical protein
MPRYEIVAHVTCELDCETADEAAAIVRRRLLTEPSLVESLLHLGVWRQDTALAPSPLPPTLRQQLVGFFADLERCAAEAEEAFRGRVEAMLMAPPVREREAGAGDSRQTVDR